MTIARQVKQEHVKTWMIDIIVILGYGFLIGVSAQFRILLPFSPVPITAQTLTVLLAGGLLGPNKAGLSTLSYLILGTFGWLPFAGGSLFGPTGGYLLGFVGASYLVGILTSKGWTKHWWSTIIMLILGNSIIYLVGLPWLSRFVGWHSVFVSGLYPFIIGDLLKITCAFGMLRTLKFK